ncbi:unnamed protein product [Prunus brigantina]
MITKVPSLGLVLDKPMTRKLSQLQAQGQWKLQPQQQLPTWQPSPKNRHCFCFIYDFYYYVCMFCVCCCINYSKKKCISEIKKIMYSIMSRKISRNF